MRIRERLVLLIAIMLPLTLLAGCAQISYYHQAICGEVDVLAAREPIAQLIAAPDIDPKLSARLRQALEAREFASTHLRLPDNASYTQYADVERRYVVWNVFAAPELSLKAVTHCFPVAGCVSYQGFYAESAAQESATQLQAQGYDVDVGGVPAYSTLGWFNDPILSTMMAWDDDQLDSTIFHELAHQKLYIKNDTAFNESFATFVERQGLREWRAAHALPPADDARARRSEQFTQLILDARKRLETLYASDQSAEAKRAGKQAEFARLQTDYAQLRDGEWGGYKGYDGFFKTPLNNAKLLPFGLYDQSVPAFAALFQQAHGDWPAFYTAARQLGDLPSEQRATRLRELSAGAQP
jgi:predicted aminopeptidase